MVLLAVIHVGDADGADGFALYQLANGLAHDFHAIDGILDGHLIEWDADDEFGFFLEYHIQQSIIGAEIILIAMEGEDELFGSLFEEIYQDDMIGIIGEIPEGAPTDIGCLWVIEGRDGMGYIDDRETGIDLQ